MKRSNNGAQADKIILSLLGQLSRRIAHELTLIHPDERQFMRNWFISELQKYVAMEEITRSGLPLYAPEWTATSIDRRSPMSSIQQSPEMIIITGERGN